MTEEQLQLIITAKDLASNVMAKVGDSVSTLNNNVKTVGAKAMEQYKSAIDSTKTALVGMTAGAGAGLLAFGAAGLHSSIQIQDAMADVKKAVGLTSEETDYLRDRILNLGPSTRTAVADLIDIAKIGGAIGVSKDQIIDFTKAIDKVSVALGDEFTGGAEEVTAKLGTLRNLFKDTANIPYADAMLKVEASEVY